MSDCIDRTSPRGVFAFTIEHRTLTKGRSVCQHDQKEELGDIEKERKYVNTCYTKVIINVLILEMCHDGRMTHRILSGFVDPRVERHDINVLNLFSVVLVYLKIEVYSICSTTKEGITWFQGIHVWDFEITMDGS